MRSLNINEENDNSVYGNRFEQDLIPIYLLLSMSGGYYAIYYTNFLIPLSKNLPILQTKTEKKNKELMKISLMDQLNQFKNSKNCF